jgi:chromosome segregation ATPase
VLALGLCGFVGVAAAQDAGTRYAQTLAEARVAERYNAVLQEQLASQQNEIAALEQQLGQLDTTALDVQPLLQRMFDELVAFVEADLPFLKTERTTRIERLQGVMLDLESEPSEKYRRLLEAYQIEMEYGRTMDTYKEMLQGQEAEFVRLGRVSLMYRKEDGETGYWDQERKDWVADPGHARAIQQALEIANEITAPDLITVPVPAPQPGGRS